MKRTGCLILVLILLLAAVPAALADSAVVHLPDLMTFSDGRLRLTQTDTSEDYLTCYRLEGDAEAIASVVDEYVALLDGCGDVMPASSFPIGSDGKIVAYTCKAEGVSNFGLGNSEGGWRIEDASLCIAQVSSTALYFYVATGLSFQNGGSGAQAGAVEDSAATNEIAADGPVLPDPYYFFQGKFRHREDNGGISMGFGAEALDAVYEYVDLLQSDKFQLDLRDTWHDPVAFGGDNYYIFDYTGGQTLTGGRMRVNGKTEKAAVIVFVDDCTGLGFVNFTIVADDAFTYVDDGSRVSYTSYSDFTDDDQPCAPYGQGTVAPSSGGGSGSGGGSSYDASIYETRDEPCQYCGGDGIDRTCLQCGGDGIMDGSGTRCSACHGTGNHECNFCGGTGRRYGTGR